MFIEEVKRQLESEKQAQVEEYARSLEQASKQKMMDTLNGKRGEIISNIERLQNELGEIDSYIASQNEVQVEVQDGEGEEVVEG